MSEYLTNGEALSYTADKIRAKTGGADPITWDENKGFGDAVEGIEAALSTPYMVAEYVDVDQGGGKVAHEIKTAKLYNHTRILAHEFSGQSNLRGLDMSDPSNNITTVELQAFLNAGLVNLVLPDTVTTLQSECFSGASIRTFTVPPLVTELPPWAFQSISQYRLASSGEPIPINIILPEGLTKIGNYCFQYARIENIDLPSTVTEIGEYAFADCKLKSLTLPAATTTIQQFAFSSSDLSAVTIPASVTTIGVGIFSNCTSLTSINIQAQVTEIPEMFADNCPLTSIILPDTVQTIGTGAFDGNSAILEITIPAAVTSIGVAAFWRSSGVGTVTVLPTTPPTLGADAFNENASDKMVIKVPAASVEAYKAAPGWSAWADKITAISA